MQEPHISLIAALGARTRAIGSDNTLLWRIPEDLKRFKELTVGHPIVMGRRTYESIGKPLPNRANIVLSDTPMSHPDEVVVCTSLQEALEQARATQTDEVFVIGGGSVYAQTIGDADRLYLTLVDDDMSGDTFFPEYQNLPFTETARDEHMHDALRYTFVTLERRP